MAVVDPDLMDDGAHPPPGAGAAAPGLQEIPSGVMRHLQRTFTARTVQFASNVVEGAAQFFHVVLSRRASGAGESKSESSDATSPADEDRFSLFWGMSRRFSAAQVHAACRGFAPEAVIAAGRSGTVYRGRLPGRDVAVKVLDTSRVRSDADRAMFRKQFDDEVALHSSFCDPNVVALLGSCVELPCLVFELLRNGSLEHRLRRAGGTPPLAWHTRFAILRDICQALVLFHSQSVAHLNLKPDNVLLGCGFVAKLSDVGMAQILELSTKHNSQIKGTIGYICPQYMRTGDFGMRSDIYALGVIIWDVLGGLAHRAPPPGREDLRTGRKLLTERMASTMVAANTGNALNAYDPQQLAPHVTKLTAMDPSQGRWPPDVAAGVAALAVQCTRENRRERPSASEVLDRLEVMEVAVAHAVEGWG